jgi:nucleoid-associated protein YgaU
VASAVLYQPVLDLVALALLTPNDGEFFELQDSTGAESDPSITGVPIGLVGDTGLSFRLRYDDPPGEYVFLEYFATDSETRYAVKATEADATQALSDAAAAQGDATQALLDAAAAQGDATQALSDAAAAQSTANAALPASGGTLTGDVVLANQTDIRFGEATVNGSNYVGFQAPASITSDVLWTLPATDAAVSGYALKSDGSGNLSWGLAGGALGGGTDQVFYENDQTVTTNYTLGTNKNAVTAGPITINSGVTVTVPAGQSWVIV